MSILQQIRERGAKRFIFGVIDDTVVRITAGLNINDVRSVLRGDPAAKPNPRVKPHTEGFILHIRPTFYHQAVTTLYPTFRLGFLSAFLFLIEIITGAILMVFYSPTPDSAYQSIVKLLSGVPLGQFTRDIHRLAAEGMVIVVCLHMLRTFLTGSYNNLTLRSLAKLEAELGEDIISVRCKSPALAGLPRQTMKSKALALSSIANNAWRQLGATISPDKAAKTSIA